MKKKLAAHFSQGRNILTYLLVAGIITALFACPQTPSADDWQLVPYEPCYYVALWGSDSNAGIAESLPFKSLARALEKTKTDPQRKTIYVLSDLNAATENSGSMEAVFLVDGTGGKEITIAARAQAILSGALDSRPTLLVRKGSRLVINNITFSNSAAAGILVRDASVLTLSGAKSITNRGGTGLIIEGGSQCIMEDGAILNNLNTGGPGGVHVRGSSGFTMTGTSLVQGNQGAPGGVLVEDASLFTMKNGASVAGNFAV
ncbi:MAG: right-handed parallel beta-helix repeat-containing protein, partial [Spirochaetales bacterium]|nr:right-handed parallel beta-helix repeat-containing protein [Spirochaetales bacterium]